MEKKGPHNVSGLCDAATRCNSTITACDSLAVRDRDGADEAARSATELTYDTASLQTADEPAAADEPTAGGTTIVSTEQYSRFEPPAKYQS